MEVILTIGLLAVDTSQILGFTLYYTIYFLSTGTYHPLILCIPSLPSLFSHTMQCSYFFIELSRIQLSCGSTSNVCPASTPHERFFGLVCQSTT